MDKATILKIKKLFALAEGSNFPEEAANALGKAQALMLKFKVDSATLDGIIEDEEDEEEIQRFTDSPLNEEDENKKKLSKWKSQLAKTLCDFNGCWLYISGSSIILVGKPSDVSTVRYLYQYCIRQIDRLTKKHTRGKGRTYANNFRYGCVDSIHKAMKAELEAIRQEFSSNERGLIIVDNTLLKIKEDCKNAESQARQEMSNAKFSRNNISYRYNNNARLAGQLAGKSIYNGKSGRENTSKLNDAQKRLD